jgi:hypothetical protein
VARAVMVRHDHHMRSLLVTVVASTFIIACGAKAAPDPKEPNKTPVQDAVPVAEPVPEPQPMDPSLLELFDSWVDRIESGEEPAKVMAGRVDLGGCAFAPDAYVAGATNWGEPWRDDNGVEHTMSPPGIVIESGEHAPCEGRVIHRCFVMATGNGGEIIAYDQSRGAQDGGFEIATVQPLLDGYDECDFVSFELFEPEPCDDTMDMGMSGFVEPRGRAEIYMVNHGELGTPLTFQLSEGYASEDSEYFFEGHWDWQHVYPSGRLVLYYQNSAERSVADMTGQGEVYEVIHQQEMYLLENDCTLSPLSDQQLRALDVQGDLPELPEDIFEGPGSP